MWRNDNFESNITDLIPGISIDILVGTKYQYRNVSDVDFKFICILMPRWPGDTEATFVQGKWQPTVKNQHASLSYHDLISCQLQAGRAQVEVPPGHQNHYHTSGNL